MLSLSATSRSELKHAARLAALRGSSQAIGAWGCESGVEAFTGVPNESSQPPDGDLEDLRRVMVRAIERACPRWLAHERDDLVQEAMIRVMKVREARPADAELPASYLAKVAYSCVVDGIRTRRRRPEKVLRESDLNQLPAIAEVDPEQWSLARELGQAIRDCLEQLILPRRRNLTEQESKNSGHRRGGYF